ncbi:hypothetical protein G3A_14100 [Bacillus sp. 17376]|uniref:Uncharacterized protein n=1 Tax=Mesobacillus boroniphilus JCM 21738 TaxID=1294265 RepID=W4RNU3_9BACI|nr:hypothetical protein [Mesobacillus boroniphilus]ESU31943.1 hypothetical protein G3A_14100 [Bacillus sp. 17376]GAE45807.1 hypothetical protein JCM21738_2653 [Mesobacillus boroniphilus JCM 21738]
MNLSQFLAVCKDRPNDPDGFFYTVYFVNNTEQEIENLSYATGGFATFDDEVVQTSIHEKSLGKVQPYSAVKVEEDDEGAFDFTIQFDFELKLHDGETEKKNFMIGKYLSGGTKPFELLPVLSKYGYAFKSK